MMPTGWSVGSRTIDEMARLYPESGAVRVFFGPGEGLPASAWSDPSRVGRQRLTALPAGCRAIVSFKDQGVDRLAFVEAWQQHRPDVDLDLITHHEPEQQKGGDPTPAQYRTSWARTREQVGAHPARAAGRLRLATCWTLQWIRRGGDWRQWFPDHEADAVDLLLFDWYPFMASEPDPWKPRVYEEPASALKVPVAIAAELGKDWGIAEIDHPRILRANGFSVDLDPDGTLAASWYRATHAAAKAAGCQVWAHFHANAGAAVGDLTLRPAEQQVLRELIIQEAPVTTAPRNLLDVRQLLLAELGPYGLISPEVGIVGDVDHRGGYHCGQDRTVRNDYSVVESRRDSTGLTDYASALDVGTFSYRDPDGRTHNLPSFSVWCVGQCEAGAEGTADIREIIYSPDGRTVKRWDRLGKRTTGDDSHLIHTHFSFFRDSTKAGRDQTPLFRRYLTSIGLLEDDMPTAKEIVDELLARELPSPTLGTYTVADHLKGGRMAVRDINRARAELAAGFGRDFTDEQAIVAGVLAGLPPEAIAAAIPKALAQDVADELAARLAS